MGKAQSGKGPRGTHPLRREIIEKSLREDPIGDRFPLALSAGLWKIIKYGGWVPLRDSATRHFLVLAGLDRAVRFGSRADQITGSDQARRSDSAIDRTRAHWRGLLTSIDCSHDYPQPFDHDSAAGAHPWLLAAL